MKIKYISCDDITEVEEEILTAEFYVTEICGVDYNGLQCERSPESEYYDHIHAEDVGANTFTVDFDRVQYIKA